MAIPSRSDLFGRPVIERRAELPSGAVFSFGGRPLLIVKAYGTDDAAPVIVEELTDRATLKGQLGLWSAADVSRRLRLIEDAEAAIKRVRSLPLFDR